MIRNILLFSLVFGISIQVNASSIQNVSEDLSEPGLDFKLSYQKVTAKVVTARDVINKSLRDKFIEIACSASDALEENTVYDTQIVAKAVAVNKNYVGFEVSGSEYCGGAHPSHFIFHLTYDAKTGEEVEMDKEVPRQAVGDITDWEDREKLQMELAEVIYKNLANATDQDMDNDCYSLELDSATDIIDGIAMYSPSISGLSKNKKVILQTSPPHAAFACALTVVVDYSRVKKFITPTGKLSQWLK